MLLQKYLHVMKLFNIKKGTRFLFSVSAGCLATFHNSSPLRVFCSLSLPIHLTPLPPRLKKSKISINKSTETDNGYVSLDGRVTSKSSEEGLQLREGPGDLLPPSEPHWTAPLPCSGLLPPCMPKVGPQMPSLKSVTSHFAFYTVNFLPQYTYILLSGWFCYYSVQHYLEFMLGR